MEGPKSENPKQTLTPEEIKTLLSKLRAEEQRIHTIVEKDFADDDVESLSLEEKNKMQLNEFTRRGIKVASDHFGQQQIEELAEFYNIDIELLRTMPIMDALTLAEGKNSPNEKFLLMILCSQAKLENDNKSINVKRGLRTRVEMGLWPGPAPTGYFKEKRMDRKCESIIDPERAPVIKKMFEKVAYEKWSGKKVYNWLRFELNFRTAAGKKHLCLGNIFRTLSNPFYYGTFEYPKKSGNWYQGKHEPVITKELFDQVQTQLRNNVIRIENKEFAFTKLMTCGLCGSGISADEKFKKHPSKSTVRRYVYYGCTKAKDVNCKCGYIEEKELIKQFEELLTMIDLDEAGIKQKFKAEVERFKKFQRAILNNSDKIEIADVDIRNYAKYILRDGTDQEKRELLGCLKSRIILKQKNISLVT